MFFCFCLYTTATFPFGDKHHAVQQAGQADCIHISKFIHLISLAYYRNTEISNLYLTKSSPKSQYHIMMYYSNTSCALPIADCFAAVWVRSEEEMLKFMAGQNSIWSICGRDVLAAFDLSPFRHIYDLGGGGGALAQACVSVYPNSTVTIYDLPKVVQVAKEWFVPSEEHQITFHKGDFFKDSIPEADLYILSKILHDWDDDKCKQLLAKVHKACKPGGGVLLVESLLNEDKSGPLETQLYSLNMLVQTEGKERTPAEYRNLLQAAGFTEIQVKRTGKLYDAILGRK
uniref:Acetylserotonin O-methyltransferase n=1 Tax=Dromaius novaehollandiae TaxID=8790 RepID=A0A8C4P7V5_DRONO